MKKKHNKNILPCPFCGSKASQWWTEDTEWIQCSECFSCTDVFEINSGKALLSWNKRIKN